jgi:hypothetical protein
MAIWFGRRRHQNVTPTCSRYARGVTKCVPPNVDSASCRSNLTAVIQSASVLKHPANEIVCGGLRSRTAHWRRFRGSECGFKCVTRIAAPESVRSVPRGEPHRHVARREPCGPVRRYEGLNRPPACNRIVGRTPSMSFIPVTYRSPRMHRQSVTSRAREIGFTISRGVPSSAVVTGDLKSAR